MYSYYSNTYYDYTRSYENVQRIINIYHSTITIYSGFSCSLKTNISKCHGIISIHFQNIGYAMYETQASSHVSRNPVLYQVNINWNEDKVPRG